MYSASGESEIRFVGQYDKSKIPVGDHKPIRNGVHIKHKVIVLVYDKNNTNKASDHDFSKVKIVASIILFGNIPT